MTGDAQDEKKLYLTLAEAARLCGFSQRTLTRWAQSGRLPSVMVAGERRLMRADLEALAIPPDDLDG